MQHAAARCLRSCKGDTNRSWRSSAAPSRSCCTFHSLLLCCISWWQSAGRLCWQVSPPPPPSLLLQMPVAQMPDIKGKSSAQDSATRLLGSATSLCCCSEIEASVEALWHHVASTKYPIYIHDIPQYRMPCNMHV